MKKLNWNRGLGRVAVVLSALYWIAVIWGAGIQSFTPLRVPPTDEWSFYDAETDGYKYNILAMTDSAANDSENIYKRTWDFKPVNDPFGSRKPDERIVMAEGHIFSFTSGVPQAEVKASIIKYLTKERSDLQIAQVQNFLVLLVLWGLGYALIIGIMFTLRWILRGFEGSEST